MSANRLLFRLLIGVALTLFAAGFTAAQTKDTLRIGYHAAPPFIEVYQDGSIGGINWWLWQQIQKELNQPYTLEVLTLDSLLHRLAKDEIDMALSPLTITSERLEVMDFSYPYYISNSALMIGSSSPLEQAIDFTISFLSITFLRAVGLLLVVIFVFGFFTWLFERKQNPEEFQSGWKGLWSGVWWSAVTMTTVGYGDKSPKSVGGRIIALIWMFVAIMILSGLTASITSSLTVNELSWNQDEIYDFKDSHLGTVSSSATERWLARNFFEHIHSYNDLEECLLALEKGEIDAITYDEPLLRRMVHADSLNRYELLDEQYNWQLYAFGFSERLSQVFQDQFSLELLDITESTDWLVLLSEYGIIED